MDIKKIEYTVRGFEIVQFRDHNDQECSLQQSSLAIYEKPGTGAIWLGVRNNRMHLTDTHVLQLVHLLMNWCVTGSFKES